MRWLINKPTDREFILDTAALDDLERKLIVAERDFIESDLERRIEEMRVARVTQVKMDKIFVSSNSYFKIWTPFPFKQNQWVRDYEEELARLRLEVDNIEAIKNALPDGCWKRLKLEP